MKTLTNEQYNAIHPDFRGIYQNWDGKNPELKGKKTMLSNENGATVLLIEGTSFNIVENNN